MERPTPFPSLLRSSDLATIVPYSMNHIRRLEECGQFPKRIRLGANRVGWLRSEVEQWLDDRLGGR